MPFDTTYHIPAGENKVDIKYTAPGGQDTDIYLQQNELPPGIDEVIKRAITSERNYGTTDNGYRVNQKKDHYTPDAGLIVAFIAVFIFILVKVKREVDDGADTEQDNFSTPDAPENVYRSKEPFLTYYGEEMNFSDAELTTILTKRFPYFNALAPTQKARFLERLHNFIANKIFKIHDAEGYKEMPVLISAAAIQLTFGLEKYLLPNFQFIHVYPQEFMRVEETINFLEGNVSGHCINLSWKHFLEGYANPVDGQNVGLHELAHTLYYQTFIVEENVDPTFRNTFDNFNNYGNKVFEQELQPGNDLYSDYALKNFQEFWAESAEIFFEKPAAMKAAYPLLYDTIKTLLNQDPYNKIA
jgi:hypothetical protein